MGGGLLLALLFHSPAVAQVAESWPGFGGPSGDFRLPAATVDPWDESGPEEIWRRPLGDGNSGIAVVGDRLFTMYRRDGEEVTVALDRATGETVWERSVEQGIWDGFLPEYGFGPHTTPTVGGRLVCSAGIGARLRCLDRASGATVWERDLWAKFDVAAHEFGPAQLGHSSSPIISGDRLYSVAGGGGTTVVALELSTGDPIWESQSFPPGFATPLLIDVGGRSQLVVFGGDRVAGLDPDDGDLLWEVPHETAYMVNAATPVWLANENLLVVSSAYDFGAQGLMLKAQAGKIAASQVWASRSLQVHHQSAVRFGDVVHASSGDFGPAFLVGLEASTGELRYRVRGFAKANLLLVGDRLLLLDEDGVLALVDPSSEPEPRILAKSQVLDARSWSAPSLVDGLLYARDREEIVALRLAGAREP